MRYCPHCQRNVRPHKSISPLAWVFIIILGGITFCVFFLFFLIWYAIKPSECPICGATDLMPAMAV